MSNSLRLQKAFTFVVAAATIIATAGLSAFVPSEASAASYGDLIKGETLSTVYYYGSDGQRYSFPNEKTFFSWFTDFDGVVTISDAELADITLAGNIVYRPGSRWVKITSDEKTYAIAVDGSIHWIESEEVAEGLAGSDWNTNIDDVPDVFFVDYTVGDSLISAEMGYDGMLWTDGTEIYLVWDGSVHMISDAGMTGNMFQAGFVLDGSGFDMSTLTSGSDITGELAYLTDAAQMVEGETYAETQMISVSLASSSPASSTLVAGQGLGHLGSYTFTNSSSSDAAVRTVAVSRGGVSADSTLSNVYLFNGWTRLSDAASVSSGTMSWNDASGLFTVPAGSSVTIDVRSDIAASTAGQTISVALDPDDVVYTGAFESSGASISSSTHTVATVTGFGAVSFATTTTPAANSSVSPEYGYKVWENTITVSNNEAWLTALRFRNIGSISASDLGNWTLYVAGVSYGSVVAQQDANGYVTFDLSDSPVQVNTGTHTIKVLADIWGGSTRTVTVGLRNAADAIFIEDDYAQPILVQVSSDSFSARDAGAQTIASGDITFTKKTTSASGNVINGASNVSLATYEVTATGEPMKVEALSFSVTEDDSHIDFRLRNGAVYVDGVQVGSTSAICGDDTTTASGCTSVGGSGASYTTFTFGSSFIVYPGSPVTMDVRADLFDSLGTNEVVNNDTVRLNLTDDSTSNVMRMTSSTYVSAPGEFVSGNTLGVAEGSVTLAKNTSFANQTVVVPKTALQVGSWTITANTTEAVNVTSIDIDFDADDDGGVAIGPDDYTSLYITYGPNGTEVMSSIKSTVSTANSWSLNYELEPGEIIYVNAYANVASSASGGVSSADNTVKAEMDVAGNAVSSGASFSRLDVEGQTMTYHNAGSFTEFNDSHPVAVAVAANQEVEVARYRFQAQNESYTIKELTTSVASATVAGNISSVKLYDGSTLLGTTVYDESTNTRGTFEGLSVSVASNTSKTLIVKYVLNDVGPGAGTSQSNVVNTLYSVKFADSQGVETLETSGSEFSSVNGNAQWVFKSVPTFNHVDLTNSTLVNGQATDLYKFTVTADPNGSVTLKQFKLTTAWSDGGTPDTLEVESLKLYKNGSDITSLVAIQDEDGNSVKSTSGLLESDEDEDLVVTWTSEDTIAAGETVTYVVRGTPQGFRMTGSDTVGDSVSFYLGTDASANEDNVFLNVGTGTTTITKLFTSAEDGNGSAVNAEVIWSDVSSSGHTSSVGASSSGDWHNGFLLQNLDLGSETWTK